MSRRLTDQLTSVLVLLQVVLLTATGCSRSSSTASGDSRTKVSITQTADGFLISEGPDSVLLYRDRIVEPERDYARAHYIHPLFDLDGRVLTEDFPEDHLHQHGVFWAWHQLFVGSRRVGDGWIQENVTWEVREVAMLEGEASASVRSRVHWRALPDDHDRTTTGIASDEDQSRVFAMQNGTPRGNFVEEITTITAHPSSVHAGSRYREIDFEIALRALVDSVLIGGSEDEKGYGGFSVRVRLPDDVKFLAREGFLEPRVTAVEGGPWVDLSGTFLNPDEADDSVSRDVSLPASNSSAAAPDDSAQGPVAGIAILQHPSNPGFPQGWILRERESMQNVRWPGGEPTQLPLQEAVNLRYRLIIHDGEWSAALLDEMYDQYTSSSD